MITRDSRRKPGKRLHHALEDVVGLKQGAFHRLASTTRRVILCEKIVKSVAGDLSRKFWSAEISVRRTKITGKIGPPGPNFPGKIGPTLEIMVRV